MGTSSETESSLEALISSCLVGSPDAAAWGGVYGRYGKRGFDFVIGSLLLVFFAPLIALAWLGVRLTSPGAGFFAQNRVGLHGKLVRIYKLRSMYVDQDHRVDSEEIARKEAVGILHKIEDDPRVTRVGRFLRKTSMDELPQIWNVVRGDMSLVGPRPLLPPMLAPYPEISAIRNRVRPGITGKWQVSARPDNTSALGMARYDLEYVKNVSFARDIGILLRTFRAVIKPEGAY
jgi:exopolysaccharide production protein ExoY